MIETISTDAKVVLMLTSPLIGGSREVSGDLLSPGEYKRLAQLLRKKRLAPRGLLGPDAADLIGECGTVIEQERLERLLTRGYLLTLAVEHWQARALWTLCPEDADYPQRLKARLGDNAPPILHGCGDFDLLETGGLAVVGSRHVHEQLIEFTKDIGGLAARAERTIVSGGAKGIDRSAMWGALEAGGKVVGVLADSLEKTAMNRENRDALLNGRLTLISPHEPAAVFHVGKAMNRNKLIYALADAALVVSGDFNKGGTWAGATEQLDKLRMVPVYVRDAEDSGQGLAALLKKGAIPWPNPQDIGEFERVFATGPPTGSAKSQIGLPTVVGSDASVSTAPVTPMRPRDEHATESTAVHASFPPAPEVPTPFNPVPAEQSPADELFTKVRDVIRRLLKTPMKDAEVAAALGVAQAQGRVWLKRLVDEGAVQELKKPKRYALAPPSLFPSCGP